MISIRTIERHRTDGGLILTLREKRVAGLSTVYQVFGFRGVNDPHAGVRFEGGIDACGNYIEWMLSGCPC